MKLENQLTILETSKILEKLGVKQESEFYWAKFPPYKGDDFSSWTIYPRNGLQPKLQRFSAFTVAELGEKLRKAYIKLGGMVVNSSNSRIQALIKRVRNMDNEAESRGKMLIYLLENKLI